MTDYAEPQEAVKSDTSKYWVTDDEVLEDVSARRKSADKTQTKWREDATEMYKFVAGEQWSEEDQQFAHTNKKPLVTFNRVGPIVNAVCGQQICNRQETRFLPREEGDMRKSDIWSKVVAWAREQCDAEDEESDAFRDLVITGMGWTCTTVNYDDDPAGMIFENRIDPRRMRWDPSSRKKNLADSRWVQCDWWWDEDEIKERWPDVDIEEIPATARFNPDNITEPHDATNAWRYDKNASQYDEIEGKMRVVHEIHWRLEDVYQIPDGDKITTLSKDEWKQLTTRLKKLGMPAPKPATTKGKQYYEAWTVGATVLERGLYPMKTGFEYQAVTGLRDDKGAWYGLALPLMDPQRFANKTFSQIIQILNSNAKGGIVAEKGAVENKAKFEQEWSKSDGVAWVEDGAVAGGRIQPKPPPQIPAELTKLLEYSVGGMREVTGVNVEFLGQTDKVQPGIVEAMRTKAGLVILAPWFDAMRLYMKRQGRLLGEFIYTYIADGRWVRISGLDNPVSAPMPPQGAGMGASSMAPAPQPLPAGGGVPPFPPMSAPPQQQPGGMPMSPPQPGGMQYVQLVKDPEVLKYDIVVDESTQSRDSRERYFQALMQVVPMAMQAGVPIPPEVLDYAPLPEILRMKWKEKIQQEMSKPQQPPIQLQIEAMRGETQKAIEGMRHDSKQQQIQMESAAKQQHEAMRAEGERVIQAAQAESQRMVDQSKLHQTMVTNAVGAKHDETKMLLDARLNVFQTLLDHQVKMQEAGQKANADHMKSMQDQQTKAMEPKQQQDQHTHEILPILLDALQAPKLPIRDASGRLRGAKRKMKPLAAGASAAAQLLHQHLSAPHTVTRDEKGVMIELTPPQTQH